MSLTVSIFRFRTTFQAILACCPFLQRLVFEPWMRLNCLPDHSAHFLCQNFLENRMIQLKDYLNSLLTLLSNKKLLSCGEDSSVIFFLEIEKLANHEEFS